MLPDTSSTFGYYAPEATIRRLIAFSQALPNNVVGRKVAKLISNWVVNRHRQPVDLQVEGIKIRAHLWDNYTDRKLSFMPWRFDVGERDLMRRVLPAGGTFVDIGGNVGVYSLFAAVQMNASGRILVLEPYPPVYERCCYNLEVNRQGRSAWPQVTTLPIGVADKESQFDLYLDSNNLGRNSIVDDEELSSSQKVSVDCKPLMQILQEQDIQHIDMLKIDIEGAEDIALCPFLADAPQLLLPKFILIENSDSSWRTDLRGSITARGYEAIFRSRMNTIFRLNTTD